MTDEVEDVAKRIVRLPLPERLELAAGLVRHGASHEIALTVIGTVVAELERKLADQRRGT